MSCGRDILDYCIIGWTAEDPWTILKRDLKVKHLQGSGR